MIDQRVDAVIKAIELNSDLFSNGYSEDFIRGIAIDALNASDQTIPIPTLEWVEANMCDDISPLHRRSYAEKVLGIITSYINCLHTIAALEVIHD